MVGDGWQITSQELCALPDHQELSKQHAGKPAVSGAA
jgi:hypothetical protein